MADPAARHGPDDGVRQPATLGLPQGPSDQTVGPSASTTDTTPPAPGLVIADHDILEELGRGGMGVVYKARDRRSGLLVALKMMLSDGQAETRRFVLEARAMGELNHPGVVTIHHWGEHEGHPYYTMDFVPGVSLAKLLENRALPPEQAVRYLLGIGHAVAAAHALGIVHRDLKPGNVIVDAADQPRVLDFGLAKRHTPRGATRPVEDGVLEALPADVQLPRNATPASKQTEQGAILGTPAYMAPEQVRAAHDEVGPPADVHALGAIFFEMLSGRPPFQGQETYDTLMQVVRQDAPPLRSVAPSVPADLEEVCSRCLRKEPAERYPDAGALVADLERRWRQRIQCDRYARLTLAALLVVLLFQPAGLLFGEGSPLDLAWLAVRAAQAAEVPLMLQQAAGAAGFLMEAALFILTPTLVGLGEILWCGAWVRHSSRAKLLTALWTLAAVGGVLHWILGGSVLPVRLGLFPWLFLGNTAAALVALMQQYWEQRDLAESTVPRAEPYLRRLFATRVEARPKSAVQPREAPQPGLADFELGKTLHAGVGCTVRWARQKSLDRPVLVWFAPMEGAAPGLVVRHPDVLALHAIGTQPDGAYLVTEGVPAASLAGLLDQRPLTQQDAATLAARIARALQAFHDQGACHGRLSADWILVHGDLEPLLCPCGRPLQTAADRACDVRDLGRMLHAWLRLIPRESPNPALARICEAAETNRYSRPAELADDLERALKALRVRERENWAHALGLILLLLPLTIPAGTWLWQELSGERKPVAATLLLAALLSLVLGAVCGAFTFVRGVVQRWRLGWRPGADDVVLRFVTPVRLIPALLVLVLMGVIIGGEAANTAQTTRTAIVLGGQFLGFWLLGAWMATMVTYFEMLLGSVRNEGSSLTG